MMIPCFYAQVEPILKAAGFQGKVEGENKLDLHKGNVSLTLYHMDEPSDNAYTRVCLWFKLKNKLMKEIPPFERLWVCNDLACKFPDLAFLIDNNDAIHVRYLSHVLEAQDVMPQLDRTIRVVRIVRRELKKTLQEIINNIQL